MKLRNRFFRRAVPLLVSLLCIAGFGLSEGVQAQPVEILNLDSPWRMHFAVRSQAVYQAADGAPEFDGRGDPIPWVPDGWMVPDFDDQEWPQHRGPIFPGTRRPTGHGQGENTRVSHIQARARFRVADPEAAGGLNLSLAYRGGVVVAVNGREVARRHLPDGPLTEDSLAAPYTDAEASPNPTDEASATRAAEARLRWLDEVRIPAAALRRGVNVIAVHVVGAPFPPEANQKHTHKNRWATAGLQEFRLSADRPGVVEPNLAPPPGLQVWTALPIEDVGGALRWADRSEVAAGPRPIRLIGGRNMTVSGQAVVSSGSGPVTGVQARVSPLRRDDGASALPAEAVRVRYAATTIDGLTYDLPRPDILLGQPSGAEPVQPVWVTVSIPKDAAPGAYRAVLRIVAQGLSGHVDVPVELTVVDWDCPDPQEWRSMVSMNQSPHSVAWHYGVEMWSDRHLRLMVPSLDLMAKLGNNVMWVDVIHPSFFGNEHGILAFGDQGGRLVPDFRFFDRFLEVYARRIGEPRRIVLNVWEPYVEQDGVTVTVIGADGALSHRNVGRPGSAELWKPLMDGVRERVLARGWDERAITLGTGHDRRPSDGFVDLFLEVAPYARWNLFTHGRGDPSIRDGELTIGRMPVGLQEYPYYARGRAGHLHQGFQRGWVNDWYDSMILWAGRMMLNDQSPAEDFRMFPNSHVLGRSQGFCRQGIDFWPVVNPHRPDAGRRRMVHGTGGWGNLYRHKVRSIAVPGPEGALPTVRFEMMREGLQDTEARIFLERQLSREGFVDVLGEDLLEEVRDLVGTEWAVRNARAGHNFTPGTGWESRLRRLYAAAALAQSRLRAAGLE